MKTIQFVSVVLMVFYFGCGKRAVNEPGEDSIVGKWTWVENFYSVGGPGQWHQVTPASQTIEFKSDGSFVPSNSFLNSANRYEFVDSITIKFQPASTPLGYILMRYKIDVGGSELFLQPVDPRCIEGCNNKFRR